MNLTMDVIGAGIAIATFTAGIMRVMVIKPITDKLATLADAIVELRKTVTGIDNRSNDLRVQIAELKTALKSLQKQIDELKEAR